MDKKQYIELISFGFKYGRPNANYIFDVSFLRNPKYENKWENSFKLDNEQKDYVLSQPKAQQFIDAVIPLIKFVVKETDCVIGIGCTGGHHRSVSIVEELTERLKDEFNVKTIHRDDRRNK